MKTTTSLGPRPGRKNILGAGLAAACFAFGLSGCSILPKPTEDPTRYYVLGSAPVSDLVVSAPKGSLHLGIRAVDLPIYLRNNRTLVIRNGANEIRYQDYARWAEPLDQAVQRAIRDRLQASDAVASAEVAPFSTEVHRDFDVIVHVLQCEGGVDPQGRNTAQFSAVYEILDLREGGGHPSVVRKSFSAPPAQWDGKDFGVLTAKLSEAVSALGSDIAANLPK